MTTPSKQEPQDHAAVSDDPSSSHNRRVLFTLDTILDEYTDAWGEPLGDITKTVVVPVPPDSGHGMKPATGEEEISKAPQKESEAHNLYSRRFVMLFFICLISLTNASNLLTFTVITSQAAKFWGVNVVAINSLAILQNILTLALIVVPDGGIFVSYLAVSICNVVAGWVRWTGALGGDGDQQYDASFLLVLFGQSFCAPLNFVNERIALRLASLWFPVHRRSLIVLAQMASVELGLILGIKLGDWFQDSFWTLLLIQAVLNTVPAFGLFFMRTAPPLPPQPMVGSITSMMPRGLLTCTKELLQNSCWMALTLATGLLSIVATAAPIFIQQLLPEEMKSKSAVFSIVFFSCGLGGILLGSIFTGRLGTWKIALFLSVFGAASFAIFTAMLYTPQMHCAIAFYGISGFSLLGLVPVLSQYAAEVSVLHPDLSSEYIIIASHMLSVIGTYSTLPSVITPRISLCAFCAILGLSTALLSVCIMQQCRKKEERAMSPALGIRRVNVGHSFDWDREDLYNLFDPHRRIYQKEWEEELKRVASGQHPSVEPLP